nr:MAG TPA: hypothetical protein [Caudoviricetes sp.]
MMLYNHINFWNISTLECKVIIKLFFSRIIHTGM